MEIETCWKASYMHRYVIQKQFSKLVLLGPRVSGTSFLRRNWILLVHPVNEATVRLDIPKIANELWHHSQQIHPLHRARTVSVDAVLPTTEAGTYLEIMQDGAIWILLVLLDTQS